MGKVVDLKGQRFGRLVAIKPTNKRSKHGLVLWECQCDCGNTHLVNTNLLGRGHTTSCGCLRIENLMRIPRHLKGLKRKDKKGYKFGWLTVIKEADIRKSNVLTWRCLCRCGKEVNVISTNLQAGLVKSCGCRSVAELMTRDHTKYLCADDISNDMIQATILKRKIERYINERI